jgi:D-beta-D-heptose 7-phosphate kinase/D-beta-D-heptose 1-phosphate adenosyltransferase
MDPSITSDLAELSSTLSNINLTLTSIVKLVTNLEERFKQLEEKINNQTVEVKVTQEGHFMKKQREEEKGRKEMPMNAARLELQPTLNLGMLLFPHPPSSIHPLLSLLLPFFIIPCPVIPLFSISFFQPSPSSLFMHSFPSNSLFLPLDETNSVPLNFASLVHGLNKAHLLVIGDAILDRFITGTVDRISPDAPVPVLHVGSQAEMPGGAGNVVANLLALGAHVVFITVVGNEEANCALDGYPEQLYLALTVEPGRLATIKTRFIARPQQLLRVDEETTTPITATSEGMVLQAVKKHLSSAGAVIISDYGKGVLTPHVCQGVIQLARAARVPVLVDPKGNDYTRYNGATVVTPNQHELGQATGRAIDSNAEVEEAARMLIAQHHFDTVIATRGEQGLSIVHTQDVHHVPAQACKVADVSGAGDTVIATLAAAIATGVDLVNAAILANRAGSISVTKPGTATVTCNELVYALELHKKTKLLTSDSAVNQIEIWHKHGLKVAFTNGCFDILHQGHVHLLHQAHVTADKLIVGLNSDSSYIWAQFLQ